MNETINIRIITPLNIIFEKQTKMVLLPGSEGVLGVLPGHMSLIASLTKGLINIYLNDTKNHDITYFIHEGIAEIRANSVNVVTEFAIETTKLDKNIVEAKITKLQNELNLETNTTKINSIKTEIFRYEALLKAL